MQTNILVYGVVMTLFFLNACTSEKAVPNPAALGYQYYPLQVGDYRIYDVQEVNFSLLGGGDTSNYQLKEVIQDFHQQNKEDTSYYMYRYSRDPELEEPWQLDSVWTVRKDARRVVVVESNVAYIKLVFPFSNGLSWDANGLNSEAPDFYTIKAVEETFQKNDVNFESTLTVIERNNMDTVIQERYKEAVYAPGVGLVYSALRYIDYCATDVECLGQGIIEGGRTYVQLLNEYGKE